MSSELIYIALAWRDERFRLARRFQYAVQEGRLNIKTSGDLGRRRTYFRLVRPPRRNTKYVWSSGLQRRVLSAYSDIVDCPVRMSWTIVVFRRERSDVDELPAVGSSGAHRSFSSP